jgi:hypothetical protein
MTDAATAAVLTKTALVYLGESRAVLSSAS